METEQYKASGDLTALIYNVVKVSDGVAQVGLATDSTDGNIAGVLQDNPAAANRFATVAISGKTKVKAGAAIASANVLLSFNASGRAIAATSGHYVIGRNLETAAADGNVIRILLERPWYLGI